MTVTGFVFLMSCALIGHGQSTGTSKETSSLFTLLNGAYDNRDQVQSENSGNDVTSMRFIPAVASQLGPDPVIFLQLAIKISNLTLNVIIVAEERYRRRQSSHTTMSRYTTLSVYNVTSARFQEKPPGSITVDDVSNLRPVDLQRIDNCVVHFQTIDDNLLIGVWQNCFDSNNGIRSQYVSIVRENDFYVVVPPGAPGTSTLVPYHFMRRGPRFPIPGETSNSDNADD